MLQVIARVPAKINLVLSVGPARPDGFHDLATVFHAVSLYDEVRAAPADDLTLTVTGPYAAHTPRDATNLAVRAARALASYAGVPAQARLSVHKEIPVAAGLAGGSADAAGALLACAQLWGLNLHDVELAAVAATVGSDVPFALVGGTAVGTGRGERLRPLAVAGPLHWVLAVSMEQLGTPAVYRRLDERRAGQRVRPPVADGAVLEALRAGDPVALGPVLRNDLQDSAIELLPGLADTLQAGRELGALGGIVSGSGPTCVFLVRDAEQGAGLVRGLIAAGSCADAIAVTGPVPTGS